MGPGWDGERCVAGAAAVHRQSWDRSPAGPGRSGCPLSLPLVQLRGHAGDGAQAGLRGVARAEGVALEGFRFLPYLACCGPQHPP